MVKKIATLVLINFILLSAWAQKEQPKQPELSVSPTSVNFDASGGTKTLTVTTNIASWNVSGAPFWCETKKSNNSLILTCATNTNSGERSATFDVTAMSKTVRITVKQAGVQATTSLSVSKTEVNFDAYGGVETLTVTTNASSWYISEEPGWCSASKSDNVLILSCNENTNVDNRSDYLRITTSGGAKSTRINIRQKGLQENLSDYDRLEIIDILFADTDNDQNILNNYGNTLYDNTSFLKPKIIYNNLAQISKTVTLYYKIIMPDGTLKSGSSSPSGYTASGDVNLEGRRKNRSEYTFLGWGSSAKTAYSKIGTYTCEIWCSGRKMFTKKFEIKPQASLSVSTTEVEFEADGGTKTVSVYGVSSYTTSDTYSWCKKNEYSTYFTLTCTENQGTSTRQDNSFYVKSGGQSIQVIIKQKGKNVAARTELEKGNWRKAIKNVMYNATKNYENGKYKGELYSNSRDGLGVYYWDADGDSYWGEWSDNTNDGEGIYMVGASEGRHVFNCDDCAYYAGAWSSGDKSGTGYCYDKTGKMLYGGTFYNDSPLNTYPQTYNDVYKFECISTETNYYVGETKNGTMHGLGVIITEDGDAAYGTFTDGEWAEGATILYIYRSGKIEIYKYRNGNADLIRTKN